MKKDKGKGNYDLNDNPDSRYHSIFYDEWHNAKTISWQKYNGKLSHPYDLGIK